MPDIAEKRSQWRRATDAQAHDTATRHAALLAHLPALTAFFAQIVADGGANSHDWLVRQATAVPQAPA